VSRHPRTPPEAQQRYVVGHPKMLQPQPGINPPRKLMIDINALDEIDPTHFTHRILKVADDQFDDSQFSEENGDGPVY